MEVRHSFDIPIEDTATPMPEEVKEYFETGSVKGNDQPENATEDSLLNCPTLFRLLDLYQEEGSGGLVEKVLIDQECLRRLLNTLLPGSYESVSKIDFKALDKCTIKPLGVYGSKTEIVQFLLQINCLNDDSARILLASIGSRDDLRSGLYLALPLDRKPQESDPERAYIFFWPEDSTWDDMAISSVRRNRITFMRYLSKLTDQMIGLISPEQADAMVWTSGRRHANDHSIPSEVFDESRMFSFEVEKSTEQEEGAVAHKGFTVLPDAQKLSKFKDASQISLVPGEEKAGLLTASFEPSHTSSIPYEFHSYPTALRSIIRGENRPIILGELTVAQLKILGDHGLRDAYPLPYAQYAQQMSLQEANRQREYEDSMQAMEEGVKQDKAQLKELIKPMVRNHFSNVYPSLGITAHAPASDCERLRAKYPGLVEVPRGIEASPSTGAVDDPEFQGLKYAWHTIRDVLRQQPTPPKDRQTEFVKEILGDTSGGGWTIVTKQKGNKRGLRSAIIQTVKDVAGFFGYESKPATQLLPDPDFIQSLQQLVDEFPVVSELTDRITTRLQAYLAKLGNKLVKKHLDKVINEEKSRLKNLIESVRTDRYQAECQATGLALLNELRSRMPSSPSNALFIDFVAEDPGHGPPKFTIRGKRIEEHKPHNLFAIYPLELTEHDAHQCRSNEQYVPEPKLSNRLFFVFSLYEGFEIKFIQLIGDKCLVVVAGSKQFDLYLDDKVRLRGAIEHGIPKRFLKYDRLADPSQCIFAFDEKTRLLAFFYNTNLKGPELSLFGFDETFSSIQARGSPFSLKEWYDTEVQIDKVCFVSGSEEICLIESSGRARVLSLVTLNFRPASVQIPGQVVDAFSAPDGSCLLVSVIAEGKSESTRENRLLVYHWASFGSTQSGISPAVLPPSNTGRIVTSFEGRNRVHLVSFSSSTMAATSVALLIKQKATEFSFRSNQADSTKSIAETVNNCLIDCHRDVWTRFPVAPAVTRSTLASLGQEPRELVFASTSNLQPVDNYFTRMITKFERTTCKPINTELRATSVVATSDPPNVLVQKMPCSRYPLGSFIVEFICLIPLHLAITRDNRFIPLKDGIWDPEYERSLLGADVPGIINSLSIGWYESLLQSYMATKPVRVVSSMGEQSVGVHSIERSAQEDALLVLFNTAISNLVLFRNNFALSRDIAGLFQAAMVLDPESNPSLFNSTLAIIIKDVTDSDSRDIVKEFSLKFQKIVQKEQEQNFITRLHRGRVQIIPWPVINSSSFYTLFHHLRRYLDAQTITHPSGGVFLHNMKTLMAKIKASDWGSLDQNLATHRAQQLDRGLHNALSRGSSDESDIQSPLKNLDTDEDVSTEGPNVAFFVPDISGTVVQGDEAEMGKALDTLVSFCLANSDIRPRHITGERAYIELLQNQLYGLLDRRLEHVRDWVKINVQRFPILPCVPQFDYARKLVHLANISVLARTDIQGATNVGQRTTVRSRAKYLGTTLNQSDVACRTYRISLKF
ncbi:hypothetical protein FRC11_007233 [Ceratobasidium sp. 423]|nr:hypothetical protein FRC11_007233 [Ceratobasidium sp. 423]